MKNQPQNSQIYKIIAYISSAILLIIVGAAGFWFYQQKFANREETSPMPAATILPSIEPVVEPTVAPSLVPTPKPSPSAKTKSDLESIKEAFAKKYNRPASEVNAKISKNNGTYASGGVTFVDEMGGGWWLAYNGGQGWIIAADGNGTIPCEAIEPYNFPTDMAPECFTQDGKLIKR